MVGLDDELSMQPVEAPQQTTASATDHERQSSQSPSLAPGEDTVAKEKTEVKIEEGVDTDATPADRTPRKRTAGDPIIRASFRALSPPWKKFSVDGPTSFIEDGRRRSSRVNKPDDKPRTRARTEQKVKAKFAKSQTNGIHDTYGSGSTATKQAPTRFGPGRPRRSSTIASKQILDPQAMPPPQSRTPQRKPQVATTTEPGRRRSARVASALEDTDDEVGNMLPSTPRRKRRRISANLDGAYEDELEALNGKPHESKQLSPKLFLKIKFGPRITGPPPILHPRQISPKPKYPSLRDWLRDQDPFDEKLDKRITEDTAREEAKLRLRILDAAEPGGIFTTGACSLPGKAEEPPPQYGHWQFTVAHVLHFQTLLDKERKAHIRDAKLLAHACQEAWRKKYSSAHEKYYASLIVKTKEELDEEDRQRSILRYRQVVNDVKERWKLVNVEVEQLRLLRWEQQQQALGKQALDDMLELSTQLLQERRPGLLSEMVSDADSEEESIESDSESDGAHEDDQLTAEQLIEKYGAIEAPDFAESELSSDHESTDTEEGKSERSAESDPEGNETVSVLGQEKEDKEAMDHSIAPIDINIDKSSKEAIASKETSVDQDQNSNDLNAKANIITPNTRVDGTSNDAKHIKSTVLVEKESAADVDMQLDQENLKAKYKGLLEMSLEDIMRMNGVSDASESSTDDSEGSDEEEDEDGSTASYSDEGATSDEDESEPNNILGFLGSDEREILKSADQTQSSAEDDLKENGDIKTADNVAFLNKQNRSGIAPITPETVVESGRSTDEIEVDVRPASPVSLTKDDIDIRSSDSTTEANVHEDPTLTKLQDDGDVSMHEEIRDDQAVSTTGIRSISISREGSLAPKRVPIPSLFRGTLREYQHDGLDWLVNLWNSKTNGILADEMGLGKTVQTIALLAHLADCGKWGPHLVVVPTSVILNWEMEFKKFLPGFKILSYYGDQEERKQKRVGWKDEDKWNVVITSYQIILNDKAAFKRRPWQYMILDEAHNIKNFQSLRWQILLTFNTEHRLLLTGTPLQNSIQELWALLYFLMPGGNDGQGGFAGLDNFTQALKDPTNKILEQGKQALDYAALQAIKQLHGVLRPYLLRRLKADVEKQMPRKHEHVLFCRLSKRQRQLYDEFMGRSDTKRTLTSGDYLSIMGCLLSLRKVCNHPDLFETRQIVTSFAMPKSVLASAEINDLFIRRRLLNDQEEKRVDLKVLNLLPSAFENSSRMHMKRIQQIRAVQPLVDLIEVQSRRLKPAEQLNGSLRSTFSNIRSQASKDCHGQLRRSLAITLQRTAAYRTSRGHAGNHILPIYGNGLLKRLDIDLPNRVVSRAPKRATEVSDWYLNTSNTMRDMIPTLEQRADSMAYSIQKFGCVPPRVVVDDLGSLTLTQQGASLLRSTFQGTNDPFYQAQTQLAIAFPDKRLLQYDCGKLQLLARLLRQLQSEGHRALIFTQMTRVLDILEEFLNFHGYRYLRLDGATSIEQRQLRTNTFNQDDRITVFILSSRSGGLGLNLTGADTVIFYDLDWNPAMDKQCQDRCHRIGQTREVHIYRLVSEYTIETNILRKSNAKRDLDDVIIQEGDFTTDYLNRVTYKDLAKGMDLDRTLAEAADETEASAAMDRMLGAIGVGETTNSKLGNALASIEDAADTAALNMAQKEIVEEAKIDERDFNESAAMTPGADRSASATDLNPDGDKRHVDDYMVELLDWDRRDEPVKPPKKAKKMPGTQSKKKKAQI
jgi:helicase SWR1